MGYLSLLRRRRILVLWSAEACSVFGDRLFTLALTWLAWQRSGAVAMGLVVVVESVPHIVLGSFGRKVIARCAVLRRLAVVEFAQIAVVASLPWLWDRLGLVGILVVIALLGTADAVTGPALGSLFPDLVEPPQVRAVTGLMQLTGRMAWILGPAAAAGLLLVMPVHALFWVDAATFVVSGAAFAYLGRGQRLPSVPASAAAGTDPGAPTVRAVLGGRPVLGGILGLEAVGEACAVVASVGIPIWLTARLDAGPGAYGLVLSAMGVGSVVGNVVAGNAKSVGVFPGSYCVVWLARGVLLGGYAFTSGVNSVVVVTALLGVLTPLGSVTLGAEIGLLPLPQRLRLFTVESTALHVSGMGGMLVLPALVERAPRAAFGWAGLVTVVAAAVVWAVSGSGARGEHEPAMAGAVEGGDVDAPLDDEAVARE
ncbi:MFS transporter [Streptomyces sp. SID3343]|uniref:MFS transporter n=1 Tax=Streptomyces sp. SID3343 TaxID=2690260 RepID=UPI00136A8BB7|nr:MFS transporter [Streptomyces sp. SID3343]MYW03808.1 MFS transporter [Streptomyces sp. SID3343]